MLGRLLALLIVLALVVEITDPSTNFVREGHATVSRQGGVKKVVHVLQARVTTSAAKETQTGDLETENVSHSATSPASETLLFPPRSFSIQFFPVSYKLSSRELSAVFRPPRQS